MKILPVGAELFHADRQKYGWTDIMKHNEANIRFFWNFAKAPKNKHKTTKDQHMMVVMMMMTIIIIMLITRWSRDLV